MANKITVGIDIGGTKIELAIMELSSDGQYDHKVITHDGQFNCYRFIYRDRIPTDRDKGYEDVIKRLTHLFKDALSKSSIDLSSLSTIGIGLPGSVHPQTLKMIHGNSRIFEDKDIKGDLRKSLGLPETFEKNIYIENDANCFALAEILSGIGPEYAKQYNVPFKDQIAVGIILGTGVGGGTIIKGNLLSGKNGGGSEVGHTNLYPNGLDCYCGRKGCVESYLSGSGIEVNYNQQSKSMAEDPLSSKDIFKLSQNNDPLALKVINDYKQDLSRFLTNLSNIFDPHYFVLGGGVSNQPEIYTGLNDSLKEKTFLKDYPPLVYQNKLGDSAGVIGAALLPYL